jgi:hypothetical protein
MKTTNVDDTWLEYYNQALKLYKIKVNPFDFAKQVNISGDIIMKDLEDLKLLPDVYIGYEDPPWEKVSLLELFFIARKRKCFPDNP